MPVMDLRINETRKRDLIRKLLTDAVVNLCKAEVEHHSVFFLEGTICVTSDTGAVQVVQIQEEVRKKDPYRVDRVSCDFDGNGRNQMHDILQPLTINTNSTGNQNLAMIGPNSFTPNSVNTTFREKTNEAQFMSPIDQQERALQIRELLTRPAVPNSNAKQHPLQGSMGRKGRGLMMAANHENMSNGQLRVNSIPQQMPPLLLQPRGRGQPLFMLQQSPFVNGDELGRLARPPFSQEGGGLINGTASAPTTPNNMQHPINRMTRASLSPEKIAAHHNSLSPVITNDDAMGLNLSVKVKKEQNQSDSNASQNHDGNMSQKSSPTNGPPSSCGSGHPSSCGSGHPIELNNNLKDCELEDGLLNLSKRTPGEALPGLNGAGPPIFPGMPNQGTNSKLNQKIESLKQKLTSSDEPDIANNSNMSDGDQTSVNSANGEVYNCGICGDPYTDPIALEKHYFSHEASQVPPNLLQSPQTGDKDNLGIGAIPYFMCEYCNKKFRFQSRYNEHVRMHTKEKPFPCQVCHKSFSYKGDLAKHMAVHSYPKPYSCHQCGAGFSFSGSLHKHMLKVHNIKHVPKPRSDVQVTKNYQYECHICHKRFKFQSLLERHLVIHENAGSETMGVAHYQCEYCFKRFRFRSTFIEHLRSHTKERPFTCPHCQKTFGYKADLQKHLRSKHPEISITESEMGEFADDQEDFQGGRQENSLDGSLVSSEGSPKGIVQSPHNTNESMSANVSFYQESQIMECDSSPTKQGSMSGSPTGHQGEISGPLIDNQGELSVSPNPHGVLTGSPVQQRTLPPQSINV